MGSFSQEHGLGDQTQLALPGIHSHCGKGHHLWVCSRFCWWDDHCFMESRGCCGKGLPVWFVIWAACIISSPCNEWRGYTLQPPERKLAFSVYFKPINYLRSTGIGAAIMGIALMMGMLVNPYAEALFGYLKGHPAYLVLGLVLVGFVMGLLKKK